MTAYAAPIKDMQFTLWELGGLEQVASLPGYEEVSRDLVDAILEEAAKFASGALDPINASGDREGCTWSDGTVTTAKGFREAYAEFCANGWHAMPGRPEFGGQGLPTLVSTAVQEMCKSANMAFSLCPILTMGAVEAIAHHATEELQATYLERMVAGTWTGTMNLTEPQAGSDLAALRTRAVPDGDAYRIFGTKIFITWGEHDMAENIIHLVLARLPDAPDGVKGISLFLVPKYLVNPDGSLGERNDVHCASIEHKLGIHASPTAVLSFGEKGGALGYLVGQPNRGLACMFTMMNHARLNVGLEGVAISERAYQRALGYARERIQGRPLGDRGTERKAIIHHPDVRRMLMDMKSRTEGMRTLAYFTASRIDLAHAHPDPAERARNQALVELLTPVVKGWCTETGVGVASTGIQVHGGMGFIEETGASQYLRDARIATIYEGTTGIQANDLIGRKLAHENGATMRALISSIHADEIVFDPNGDAQAKALAGRISAALEALSGATDWILQHYNEQPRAAAAGAVPYLKLTGTVLSAWLLARAAGLAQRQLAGGDGDANLLRTKPVTARFFAEHVLPEVFALDAAIRQGADSVLELPDNLF